MARPIKETPILFGEDARRFVERMNQVRKETPEERERRNANYELWENRQERKAYERKFASAVLILHFTSTSTISLIRLILPCGQRHSVLNSGCCYKAICCGIRN